MIKIEFTEQGIEVTVENANLVKFTVNEPEGKDAFYRLLFRLANVCVHISRLDGDVMQAYDNAFRTRPRAIDIHPVREFVKAHPETSEALSHLLSAG